MKASDAELLVSTKVADKELLGVFQNSLHLANYENSHKRLTVPDQEKKEEDEEDVDPRTKRINKKVENITISTEKSENSPCEFWKASALSTELARNLANTRGSVATPGWMEEQIHSLLAEYKDPKVKEVRVLDHLQLQELGMNLFYNVGKAAESQPRCVMVHYKGNPSDDTIDIALVGKGVTFDTGGLNLKPGGSMVDMYGDKGGSCAVIGALKGVLENGCDKNVIFAVGLAENAIGSRAYKP